MTLKQLAYFSRPEEKIKYKYTHTETAKFAHTVYYIKLQQFGHAPDGKCPGNVDYSYSFKKFEHMKTM